MDGLERFDHTHAIFAGFTSIWQRILVFCACGVLGQFVGGNIYNAPKFIGNVIANGPGALADLRPMDLAWLPMEWAGALLVSAFHVPTLVYLGILLVSFLSFMRADDLQLWPLADLVVGQPIDAWLVRQSFGSPLIGNDMYNSLALLAVYTALTTGGFYAWWRVREDQGE